MPGINFGGLASGLPPNIVEQLVAAERIPIRNMESKKSKAENRLKLVNDLDAKLSNIRNTIGSLASNRGFQDYKIESTDPNIVTATVDPNIVKPGNWNVEIIQLAKKAGAVTNGFPDKDKTALGTGYFKFETKDGEKEIYLSAGQSTLTDAVETINSANVGIRASIINDRSDKDYPYRLMLTAEEMGGDNDIKYPTLYFLNGDQDLYFETEKPANNGVVKIDGFEFEVSDNKVEDLIPGVTLGLKQAAVNKPINITVSEDTEVVSGKIKQFVDAINDVLSFIQQQNKMTKDTDTSSTLGGDGLLRSVENRLRSFIQNNQMGVQSPIKRLNQLGVEFNRDGTLNLDQDKFDSVLSSKPESVHKFLAGDGFEIGFIPTLKNTLTAIQDGVFGPIGNRRKSLQSKIRQIDDRISSKERQIAMKEKSLRRKFSNLETNMSKLKAQMGQVSALGGG